MNRLLAWVTSVALIATHAWAAETASPDTAGSVPGLYHDLAEMKGPATQVLAPGLRARLLLEMEASYLRQDVYTLSDLALATAQITTDWDVADAVEAHAVFLWEEARQQPVTLDVGTIRVGGVPTRPWYVEAGRRYVPFGIFAAHGISDPLTRDLAAARETLAMAGYRDGALDVGVGCFNGALDDDLLDARDTVDDAVAALTWTPLARCRVSTYWTSDFGESDAIQESLFFEAIGYRRAHGIGASLSADAGPVHVDLEGLGAVEDVRVLGNIIPVNEPVTNDTRFVRSFRPSAWHAEATVAIGKSLGLFAVAEGASDFPVLPEFRRGGGLVYACADRTTLTLEYLLANLKDQPDATTVKARLAVMF